MNGCAPCHFSLSTNINFQPNSSHTGDIINLPSRGHPFLTHTRDTKGMLLYPDIFVRFTKNSLYLSTPTLVHPRAGCGGQLLNRLRTIGKECYLFRNAKVSYFDMNYILLIQLINSLTPPLILGCSELVPQR